jgi:hypothetical protein
MKRCSVLRFIVVLVLAVPLLHADALDDLSAEFWSWRANELPVSTDDIPRLERPEGWVPDWSPATVTRTRNN